MNPENIAEDCYEDDALDAALKEIAKLQKQKDDLVKTLSERDSLINNIREYLYEMKKVFDNG